MDHSRYPEQDTPIYQLEIKETFDRLSAREKEYAHHLSRACWHGTRISLRQTSPEAENIFDFILALHAACDGQWNSLLASCDIHPDHLEAFLAYAGLFLCNLGNFYSDGGQKFIPNVPTLILEKLGRAVTTVKSDFPVEDTIKAMKSVPPFGLGYPSENSVSSYYLGARISKEEIARVTKAIGAVGIEPENTRIRKTEDNGLRIFEVLQASIETNDKVETVESDAPNEKIRLIRGDHAIELGKICSHLNEALKYTANPAQAATLSHYISAFRIGSMTSYHASQKTWVQDPSPPVEHILGFVESYTDPYGVRAQFEGAVCIADECETSRMKAFVEKASYFATLLPWATPENDGKGPFEKDVLVLPNFQILHALTVCAGTIWEASNLPNYNDIRSTLGSKNLLLSNRLAANHHFPGASRYLCSTDASPYQQHLPTIRFVATAIHELLGHGTGKLLCETKPEVYNFDAAAPPLNPLTGKPIASWYLPGQTWTSVFSDVATSVEECRAIAMSAYLIDEPELSGLFGHTEDTGLTAGQLSYLSYAHLGVEGLRALEHFDEKAGRWTQAHSQAYFAIFAHLLSEADGMFTVTFNPDEDQLIVRVDEAKIFSRGKPALGELMCKLHVWRCTADVEACRAFYSSLTAVEAEFEEWRRFVRCTPESRWKFVQANTFLEDGVLEVKVYEESDRGIVQSWAERDV